jgi:hypothetical protein
MIRSIAVALAFLAGAASAGEAMDCYNDEFDADTRLTRTTPDVLRVSDADLVALRERIRAHELEAVAKGEAEADVLVQLDTKIRVSD